MGEGDCRLSISPSLPDYMHYFRCACLWPPAEHQYFSCNSIEMHKGPASFLSINKLRGKCVGVLGRGGGCVYGGWLYSAYHLHFPLSII